MNEEEKQGEEGFKLHQKIVHNESLRRQLLGNNIELLREMKDKELYKSVLGDTTTEWVAYLGQVETMYSRNSVYNYFRVYDKFVKEIGLTFEFISQVPISRLVEMLPVITKENSDDLISKALILTSRDFTDEIRQLKGLPTTDECTHQYKEYEICKVCGERHELSKKYDEKN